MHILAYFCDNNLLNEFQFGSRPFHSCETLLLSLTDEWLEAIDKGQLTGLLLVDFRKAFDLVNHDILLGKLQSYGIKGLMHDVLTSYMTNRLQMVSVGSLSSKTLPMVSGIPQGSCLGPLLFLIYVNDIPSAITSCEAHLYVDDTTLTSTSSDLSYINDALQEGANILTKWADQNKMVIHPKKTKCMIIGSQRKLSSLTDTLHLSVYDSNISKSECEKLLGVYIDSTLSWDENISKTIKKFNTKIEFIRRAKPFLSLKHTKLLYNSIARPVLEYCCSVWGNCSSELLQQLLLSQKRAARMILNADRLSPSINLFKKTRHASYL